MHGHGLRLSKAAEWLRAKAVEHYPDSEFARKHARGFERRLDIHSARLPSLAMGEPLLQFLDHHFYNVGRVVRVPALSPIFKSQRVRYGLYPATRPSSARPDPP
jgi:hypothetical protein